MKLSKEDGQKIFLSILLLIGLLYCYFTMLLGPLNKQEMIARNTVKDLAPKIAGAKVVIKDVGAREKGAPEILQVIEQIKALVPGGAPIAWLPPTASDFVKKHGIEKCRVSLGGESGVADLAGFKKIGFTLDFPQIEAAQLGKLIADIENERPLWEISEVQISATRENPQYQTAKLSLSAIVKE